MIYKCSRKKLCIILFYGVINTLCAFSVSIQGPFYPMVAEQKGVTPTQYGFVFSIFDIGVFIMNPLAGKLITVFGAVRISLIGLLTIGGTSVMFGLVNKINKFSLFFGSSIVTRILESVGYAMVRNAGITIASCEFSDNVEVAFSVIQTFYSIGQFLGPVIGGALFELGGFSLPFGSVGVLLLCSACGVLFLPKDYQQTEAILMSEILKLIRNPSINLGFFSVFGVYMNCGLIFVSLEPHLKTLNLSPFYVGSMFFCSAIALGASSFAWSKLCQKYVNCSFIIFSSSLIIICGVLLIGPAPYIPIEKSVYTCVIGLLIHGVGVEGGQVAGFSFINNGAKLAGLPQNMQTYGIVSVIFTSALCLGYFIGDLIGGYIFEIFGFPWASHFFLLYHSFLIIGTIAYRVLRI